MVVSSCRFNVVPGAAVDSDLQQNFARAQAAMAVLLCRPTDYSMTNESDILVACLCAAWCRVCEGYHEVFAALRAAHPGLRFVWVDIEDDAELVDELEVETFPTLLIGVGRELRFIGPVLPQLAPAQRLLAESGVLRTSVRHPAAEALLARLQQSCG
jgi:hypothetical protein